MKELKEEYGMKKGRLWSFNRKRFIRHINKLVWKVSIPVKKWLTNHVKVFFKKLHNKLSEVEDIVLKKIRDWGVNKAEERKIPAYDEHEKEIDRLIYGNTDNIINDDTSGPQT